MPPRRGLSKEEPRLGGIDGPNETPESASKKGGKLHRPGREATGGLKQFDSSVRRQGASRTANQGPTKSACRWTRRGPPPCLLPVYCW